MKKKMFGFAGVVLLAFGVFILSGCDRSDKVPILFSVCLSAVYNQSF
ncbi:MAG: hypothetical protein FWB78_06425 [Treponema sp.]|nr:hypothetical protein [Treponema sp.]